MACFSEIGAARTPSRRESGAPLPPASRNPQQNLEWLSRPSAQAAFSWGHVVGGVYRTQRFRMRWKRSSRWSRRLSR